MPDPRAIILFERYTDRLTTPEEEQELWQWMLDPGNRQAAEGILGEWIQNKQPDAAMSPDSRAAILEAIFLASPGRKDKAPILRMTSWKRIAIAASVILALGSILWMLRINHPHRHPDATALPSAGADFAAPQITHARITLGDGKTISLDSSTQGELARQGKTLLVQLAPGQIAYNRSTSTGEITWNLLANPNGSKPISMTLSDGSRIWLNAGSSVRYPAAFADKGPRNVIITGEAFLDITQAPAHPFIVQAENSRVEVLGTRFNINAYPDEGDIRVTLIRGSVKTSTGAQSTILRPGQQASLSTNLIRTENGIDSSMVMAWLNGRFQFGERADIHAIMRQVARWYGVDVQYQGEVQVHFGGSMPREESLSSLLKKLEATGNVHFIIQNKTVIVMP